MAETHQKFSRIQAVLSWMELAPPNGPLRLTFPLNTSHYKQLTGPASPNLRQLELSTQPASFCLIWHWSSGFWGPPPAGQDLWLPIYSQKMPQRCREQVPTRTARLFQGHKWNIWFLLTIVWQKIRASGKYTQYWGDNEVKTMLWFVVVWAAEQVTVLALQVCPSSESLVTEIFLSYTFLAHFRRHTKKQFTCICDSCLSQVHMGDKNNQSCQTTYIWPRSAFSDFS